MTKKISLASLMAIALLIALTITNSSFANESGQVEKIGAPFVFFTAADGGEVIENQQFSLPAFLADLGICFFVSFGLLIISSALNVARKKPLVANS